MKQSTWLFFFVYLLICIYVHIHTRVKIYAYVILFYPHTIQFMHSSPTKIPPDPVPINTDPPKPPLQHPTGLYNVNMYSTRTLSKNKIKLKKRNYKHIFEKKRAVPFLSFSVKEIKGGKPWGRVVSDSWYRVRAARGGSWLGGGAS